ncbi:MAG TPA: transglycosylase domain-containing protein [Streptosporangiaceae bacterium]|nr:transglycosylase domain-containing protein [Streptosporangiaceae bacterium]
MRPPRTGYHRIVDYPRTGRRGWTRFIPSWRLVTGSLTGLLIALAALVAVVYASVRVPDAARLSMPTATRYEYSDGTVFYTAGLQNRTIVPLAQIPPALRQAVVAVENPTFWSDAGIAPRGIARALLNDVEGRPLEGGSTITQQFVKDAYLTDQQTLTRKLSEIFIAVKITRAYSKRQILGDYLNTVYFGRSSYGADAAAETYFGVPVSAITDPARAAYLAALVNEPTVLSGTDPSAQARLRQRWNLVLDDVVRAGGLTRAARAAVRWPAVLPPRTGTVHDSAGVNDSAMAQVADGYLDELHQQDPAVPDSATADAGGDVIVTTFRRADMTAAVRAVRTGLFGQLNPADQNQAAADRGVQAGLATVAARTGELLAFYPGGSDYNHATQAQIEPGSQLEVFQDAARLPDLGGNAGSGSGEPTSLWTMMGRVGLTQNLVADPAELPEPLTKLEHDPALALGIAPESPARMAAAFAIFGDSGIYHDLTMALSVTVNGHRVWTFTPHGTPALSPLSTRVLAANVLHLGVPFAVGGVPAIDGASAAKWAAMAKAGKEPAGAGAGPDDTAAEFGGVPGTIGGDRSAWYTGLAAGSTVTSVALWDTQPGPHGTVTLRSLAGLGGVPASGTASWPTTIWSTYVKTTQTSPGAVPIPSG